MKIVTKNGYAFVETTLKVADLELVKKYDPAALVIKGGEDGKQPVFFANVVKNGNGMIDGESVEFIAAADGTATVTIADAPAAAKASADAMKEYLADLVGPVSCHIAKLEETVPAAAEAVRGTRKAVMDAIQMA